MPARRAASPVLRGPVPGASPSATTVVATAPAGTSRASPSTGGRRAIVAMPSRGDRVLDERYRSEVCAPRADDDREVPQRRTASAG